MGVWVDGDMKRRLRKAVSESLRSITHQQAIRSGRRVLARLSDWDGFARSPEIVAYSALVGEVDLGSIFDAAHLAGKRLLLPRIVGEELEFAQVDEDEELIRGRHGVLEPDVRRVALEVDPLAIVLVPGVAFDRRGGRLGRGAGYYDRALSDIRRTSVSTTFIGVGFPRQIVDEVPMTSQDVRMDGILTEEALVWVDRDAHQGRD
jgi:5-formyltetrahydrofolate cyclo-ligase